MKNSTRKVINHLRQYVGHEVLRTKPACGDWSYTDDSPILLVGFTSDGCIRYRHTGWEAQLFGDNEFILPFHFTDRNWITYKKALKAKGNELNEWRGKKIRRICPTSTTGDRSFMSGEAPTLISASKHHMVIMRNNTYQKEEKSVVLRSDYMNPKDWELAE